MSPTIRQYRDAAFKGQSSGAGSERGSGGASMKSGNSSPNSWEVLADINI